MSLVAALDPVAKANTGRLKFIAGDPIGAGSLVGLIEPKLGWLLLNAVVLTNTGRYAALYAMVGTRFGSAGQLPSCLDGRVPIPKGASAFPTVGVAGGEINHILSLAEYPNHTHASLDNLGDTSTPGANGLLNIDGFAGRTQGDDVPKTSNGAGGGGSHPNMPLYQVGGYVLVKL